MRKLLLSCLAVLGIFASSTPASALPCCSACDENPRVCRHGCSPSCRADEEAPPPRTIHDDVLKLCYLAD